MKTFPAYYTGRLTGLSIIASITLAVLALGGRVQAASAEPPSPVGQWDCIMSGAGQSGIIFLNFTPDMDTNTGLPTFEGIFVQGGHNKNADGSGRDGSTGNGRGNTTNTVFNLFGGGYISGTAGGTADNGNGDDWFTNSLGRRGNWFYNEKGQTVGNYYTVESTTAIVTNFFGTCTNVILIIPLTNDTLYVTNYGTLCFSTGPVLSTNLAWGPAPDGESGTSNIDLINTNYTLGSLGITNNISFIAKVVPGKRLTMVAYSSYGKFDITGVPLTQVQVKMPDVFSPAEYYWTGVESQNGLRNEEVFSLLPFAKIPNGYFMYGEGPSYVYTNAICLISSQKQIGFAVAEVATGSPSGGLAAAIRGTIGPLINNSKSFGTKGEGSSTASTNVISFDANLSPFTPP